MKKYLFKGITRMSVLSRMIPLALATTTCLLMAPLAAEETIIIDDGGSDDMIMIDDAGSDTIEIGSDTISIGGESGSNEADSIDLGGGDMAAFAAAEPASAWQTGLDARLEYAVLPDDNSGVDSLAYGSLKFTAKWQPSGGPWQAQLEARVDGHDQDGTPGWNDVDLDYGDNWLRYSGENNRVTVGTQTVIWGRIDEIPPSDRLSTVDATRLNLDDLPDRKRSRATLRIEHFFDQGKLDLLYMPTFREAELADINSIWYPIDRARRKVLGIEVPTAMALTMANARIVNDAPDEDHAVGLRYSSRAGDIEYAVTAQHGRQSMPYFAYTPPLGGNPATFTAQYPRVTALGGDLAFERDGVIWRFEGVYLDDVPATHRVTGYTQVEGANWAAGMEFYPGDSNTRVNLQLAGNHLIDADNLVDRDNIYNFNGSVEIPFAQDKWRANIRFFAGLDKKDIYFNPEIAFVDWEPHELYIEAHYFDGADGTLGGFHEDHSIITAGWRASF